MKLNITTILGNLEINIIDCKKKMIIFKIFKIFYENHELYELMVIKVFLVIFNLLKLFYNIYAVACPRWGD